MTAQLLIELALAGTALVLLTQGVYQTWRDPYRRPIALLLWAFLTAILAGVIGSPPHPYPWWFSLPAGILVWEARRGWLRAPRCHLREGGLGVLALALGVYVFTLAVPSWGVLALSGLAIATVVAVLGGLLLLLARLREPAPWRLTDWTHYERRQTPRGTATA
jgi:hypothetical protein